MWRARPFFRGHQICSGKRRSRTLHLPSNGVGGRDYSLHKRRRTLCWWGFKIGAGGGSSASDGKRAQDSCKDGMLALGARHRGSRSAALCDVYVCVCVCVFLSVHKAVCHVLIWAISTFVCCHFVPTRSTSCMNDTANNTQRGRVT